MLKEGIDAFLCLSCSKEDLMGWEMPNALKQVLFTVYLKYISNDQFKKVAKNI